MSVSGPAAKAGGRRAGFFHESAFYGSDRAFLDLVVPFLRDGVAAGEPTVAAFTAANEHLVRRALGAGGGVQFIDGETQYARPASAIRSFREQLDRHVAAGATRVRLIGDVPHPGRGVPWGWWARYEAAVNHAFADYPAWGLCPYDTRTAPAEVIDHVRRTHPYTATADGHRPDAGFEDPRTFLRTAPPLWRDPVEDAEPVVDLADPTPAQVRVAVHAHVPATRLTEEEVNGLVLAASEAATNALVHGRPPIHVRIWVAPDRMLVAVTDHGPGPRNPYVGLLPSTGSATAGLGLWLAHQLCGYVALDRGPGGFTVRLLAGRPTV